LTALRKSFRVKRIPNNKRERGRSRDKKRSQSENKEGCRMGTRAPDGSKGWEPEWEWEQKRKAGSWSLSDGVGYETVGIVMRGDER